MTHNSDKMNDFIEQMHKFRYPQTVVADTVGAALTDLNEWRRREIIRKDGYEKDGRIIYTGAMLLRAGFLADLAPIIGPSEAMRFSDLFLNVSPFDLNGIKDKVAVFEPRQGDDFNLTLQAEDERIEHLETTKIVFPIWRLIAHWMVGAEARMQDEVS